MESNNVRPEQSIHDQSHDEQRLVGFVRSQVEESRMNSSRITHEGMWMTNTAYFLGFDGVYFDTTLRQFRTISRGTRSIRRNRLYVNKIMPTIQNRLAKLCKSPPKFDVRPNSSSSDDKDAARLSGQVLDMVWDIQHLNNKRLPLYMWTQQCGHAYLKVCWDDQLGKQMADPETGETINEGDIRVDVVSPFEVFVDPMAKTLEDSQWLCQAKVRKLDYFRNHFPEKGELVKPEDAWLLSAQYELRINSLNVRGQGQTGSQMFMKNCAIELAYYERKSKDHPNGRQIVCANGVLLSNKDLAIGEIPFAKFDDIVVGGKYFSESTITHMRPIQDQYSRVISMRANWTNKLANGKYLVAKGAGLQQEALNDVSGEVVEYNPVPNAPPPAALSIPVIPSYMYEEEERLEKMMYDMAGINEISRGQLPSASIPAVGMQFLLEQDDTRAGVVTESHEYAWAKVGQFILKFASIYYNTPRLLKIAGTNLDYTVKSFVGADLKESHDVIVVRGSTLPGSKVLKRQEILNAYGQGLLGDPHDPQVREKVLEMLEFGEVASMWKKQALIKAQIEKQLKDIEQGIVPEISEFDDQEKHLEEKNMYRISDKYKILPPECQQILINDMNQRIEILINRANPGIQSGLNQLKSSINNPPPGVQEQANAQMGGPPPIQGGM